MSNEATISAHLDTRDDELREALELCDELALHVKFGE